MPWNLITKCQDWNILTVNRQRYPPFETFEEERAIGWHENENDWENDILLAVWCEWRRTFAGKNSKDEQRKLNLLLKKDTEGCRSR